MVKNNINLVTALPTTTKESFDTRKLTPDLSTSLSGQSQHSQPISAETKDTSDTNDGFKLSVLVPCQDPDTGFTKKCLLVKKAI